MFRTTECWSCLCDSGHCFPILHMGTQNPNGLSCRDAGQPACWAGVSGTFCQPVSPRWVNDYPAFSLEVSSPKFSPPSAAFVKLQRLVYFHHYSCDHWNFSDFKGFCPKYPLWVQDRTHMESVCSLAQTKAGMAGDVAKNRYSWALNTRQRSWAPSQDSRQGGALEGSCPLMEKFPEKRLLCWPIMRF